MIQGFHKQGVHLMAFSRSNEVLVTCGLSMPSPVLLYEWKTATVLVATSVNSLAQDIAVVEINHD